MPTPERLLAKGKRSGERRTGGRDVDHFRQDQCLPKFIPGEKVMHGSDYASVQGPEPTKTQALPSAPSHSLPKPRLQATSQAFSSQPRAPLPTWATPASRLCASGPRALLPDQKEEPHPLKLPTNTATPWFCDLGRHRYGGTQGRKWPLFKACSPIHHCIRDFPTSL